MYEKTDEFTKLYGAEPLEQLTEAIWNYHTGENKTYGLITIIDLENYDVINCKGRAIFKRGEDEIYLTFECGNWDGLVIYDFGEYVDYKEITKQALVLKLDEAAIVNRHGKEGLKIARAKFKSKEYEIKKIASSMRYDLYFSPTSKIKIYYKRLISEFGIPLIQEWVETK